MNRVTIDWSPLEKADPVPLLKAIVLVQERYHCEGKKPGSEHWASDSRVYRPAMIRDVWLEWKDLTGEDGVFPWHDDFVCEMWIKYRKNTDPVKTNLKELLGIPETNQPQENLLC